MSREELFLSHKADIERVIAWVCSRRGLRGADAEDFASTVKMRLIENDYEILAKFEGRSSLKTYLAAVINRIYLDFQVQRFGKWRPSAEARRQGPPALRLERLMCRDGLSFDEACGVLQSDPAVTETRDALYAMSQAFKKRAVRSGPRADGPEPPSPESAASLVEHAERQALADRVAFVVRRSLGRRPHRDSLLLRLHFVEGLTVARIARLFETEQRALYGRRDEILLSLRADLEAEGVDSKDARELLSTLDWDAVLIPEGPETGPPAERDGSRPSQDQGSSKSLDGEP